ncbi:hypothetical protein AWENTII_012073 [Aspergillus wentii]
MLRCYRLTHAFRDSCKALKQQVRNLTLLEHHSHKILHQYGIPVPDGRVIDSPLDAKAVVSAIGAPSMMKAQILAGGRGKGTFNTDGKGGVRFVSTPNEALENAANMLGHYLKTTQTPPSGLLVKNLYIYKAVNVAHEYYFSITFDRKRYSPVILISDEGGVNIEANADSLHKFPFSLDTGITPDIISRIHGAMLFSTTEMRVIEHVIRRMADLFRERDAILLELNPLALTTEEQFICLDAKFEFDNCAAFRQEDIFNLEEREHMPDSRVEYEAAQLGLSYVRLDGNIGNIVNGAGLAMATNDLITIHGGKSANFLDIGGKASTATLLKSFEILNRDPRVKGILINIFGGIVRCDMIAQCILQAASILGGFRVPVVVRLQGTNSDEALKLLEDSGLDLCTETDFDSAAAKIVELTSGHN